MKNRFELSETGILEALEFLDKELTKKKVSGKDILKTRLLVEEYLFKLEKNAESGTTFEIWFSSIFDSVTTKIKCRGKKLDFSDALTLSGNDFANAFDDDMDDSAIETLQNILLKGFSDKYKISHKKNMNYIDIITRKSPQMPLYFTLAAIVLAVIVGVLMRMCLAESIYTVFCDSVLQTIKTIYMNLLSMIVGPVVFLSMITCMMQFSDMRSFGRIGGKTMGIYIFTSAVAAVVGVGVFYLIQPGKTGSLVSLITNRVTSDAQISVVDTIINIFPGNVVGAFYDNNVLHILLMGLFMGVAVNMIGEKGKILQNFFDALNDMFLQMVLLLAKLIPLITFCSVVILILTTGMDTLAALLALIGTSLLGFAIMICLYALLIGGLSKLNPIPFLKRYIPTALNVFSLSSSSASMPLNMDFCKQIGISQRIYSFTIPFGATINMDGLMVTLTTGVLFMAKTFGVPVTGSKLVMLVLSSILLSMATPGVPGASVVAFTVLLNQMGVPLDCLPLALVYLTLVDMFDTTSNTTGDVAASIIVANSENLLDKGKYYQK